MGSKSGRKRRERERRMARAREAQAKDPQPGDEAESETGRSSAAPMPALDRQVDASSPDPSKGSPEAEFNAAGASEADLPAASPSSAKGAKGPALERDWGMIWNPPAAPAPRPPAAKTQSLQGNPAPPSPEPHVAAGPARSPRAERMEQALIAAWHWNDRMRSHDRYLHERRLRLWRLRMTAAMGLIVAAAMLLLLVWQHRM